MDFNSIGTLPRWAPDWHPEFDPRFFWPGHMPGVTGCFNETTRMWDFLPRQPLRVIFLAYRGFDDGPAPGWRESRTNIQGV